MEAIHGHLNLSMTLHDNLRGFHASMKLMNPKFEGGIPDFMDGILDFQDNSNTFYCGIYRKLHWRNHKLKSLKLKFNA